MDKSSLPRPKEPTFDRVLRDTNELFSVVNLVSPEIGKKIAALPEHMVDLSEEEIYKNYPDTTPTVHQLRRMFWLEYDRAVSNRTLMDMSRVYVGVCSRAGFYKITDSQPNLSVILCPPKNYMIETEDLLALGLRRAREILQLPLVTPYGVDSKLADVQLKIIMMLDMRLKGAYVQKSVQISHNVNTNQNINHSVEGAVSPDSMKSLDERLKELESEIAQKAQGNLPTPDPVQAMNDIQTKKVERVRLEAIDAEFTEVKKDD